MGTGVIFYEELADDMSETWDVFDSIFRDKLRIRAYPSTEPFRHPVQSIHFDPDFPYDYPISSMHPDGGILHPSPPPEPYYSPPSDPTFQQFCYVPKLREVPMAPPLSYYPPLYFPPGFDGYDRIPYDPSADMAPVRVELHSPPPAPVDTGVIGEPYYPLEDYDGFIAQYFQDPQGGAVAPMEEDPGEDPMDEDQPGEEKLSAGSRAVSVGGRSELSTDTRESYA
ncbi:hypothetical protein PIB30_075626 [Stylosanthes scabra]|uniref:Uncharacterized protein n=1 Tax=Stylosanthes scabra TaxID=79078 RepID=A0ABU6XSL1_9FABA|nr:hypothetical protein [Stylosanthes scabra]